MLGGARYVVRSYSGRLPHFGFVRTSQSPPYLRRAVPPDSYSDRNRKASPAIALATMVVMLWSRPSQTSTESPSKKTTTRSHKNISISPLATCPSLVYLDPQLQNRHRSIGIHRLCAPHHFNGTPCYLRHNHAIVYHRRYIHIAYRRHLLFNQGYLRKARVQAGTCRGG